MFIIMALLTMLILVAKVVVVGLLLIGAVVGWCVLVRNIREIIRLNKEEKKLDLEMDEWLEEHRMRVQAREERQLPALDPRRNS